MKIIPLHTGKKQPFSERLKLLKKGDKAAQEKLFSEYAPKMLGVCRQYIKDIHQAEEAMLNGFFKVFTKIDTYKSKGNFEGWIRKIIVNESISFLRSHHQMIFVENDDFFDRESNDYYEIADMLDKTEYNTLQYLVDKLRDDLRTVFILFVIEEYRHKEIAELLGITENASKLRYRKAKSILKEQYNQVTRQSYGQ